ncbi:MAG: DNA internalization-related competence protein ComEC/Rec2 [Steroidobacteraceae bacterium]
MFRTALAFCAGAATLLLLLELPTAVPLWTLAVAAALAMRRMPALAAYGAGIVCSAWFANGLLAERWPCERDREERRLTGHIAAPATVRPGRTDFDLRVIDPGVTGPFPRLLRLSWYDATAVPLPGQRWRMTVRLRCPRGLANPGAADRELDLLRQRIGATGYVVNHAPVELLDDASARHAIERLRARLAAGIRQAVPSATSAAVLQGLSVGVRANLPEALWDGFAATGVAHLMAISGLHVTGCALAVLLLLRFAWRLPGLRALPGRVPAEMALVVLATAGYALLAGASAPAVRTLLMVAIVALQRVLRRTLPVHETLAIAAWLMVLADPLALTSAGFWLSFVATAALLVLIASGRGWRAQLALFVRAQAALTAVLAPVLAVAFGRLSLVAPLVNAIAIPLFSFVLLPVVLFATVLEVAWPGAAAGIWRSAALALDPVWPALAALAAWPLASFAPATQPAWLVAFAALATFAALLIPLRGLRGAAAVLLVAITCGSATPVPRGGWTLTVIDVGQGLAAVVETGGHVLVFDAGPRWRGSGAAARVSLVPFLRSRGIRRIDRLVLSHRDMDHAGGAPLLQDAFEIGRTVVQQDAGQTAGADTCHQGERWQWDQIDFHVLHPPAGMAGSDNDRSCVLSIRGRGGSALLLADPESTAEQALLAMPLAADVVLLPHHGSKSSSTHALVVAVAARLGIASSGFGNRWGMPAGEVVARWRAAGTTVLNTATAGAVRVQFGGGRDGIKVATERRDTRRWWRQPATD